MLVKKSLYFGFHVLVLNIILNFVYLYTFVRAEFYFGFNGYGSGHRKTLFVEFVYRHVGAVDRFYRLILIENIVIIFAESLVNAVLVKSRLTVMLFDNSLGNVSFSETRYLILTLIFFVSLILRVVPFFGG